MLKMMNDKLKKLVDKLKSMTEKEKKIYLNKCYLDNKEAINAVLSRDPKNSEMLNGVHIVGSELFEEKV